MSYKVTRRARLLAGAAFGAIGLLAGAAAAQDAPQEDAGAQEIDEVIVTGIRASIQSSIAAKRNNTSIVEVVTAEDIGKLPDTSITESLARLPGLAAQRLDGRSQNISVRGLGPDFTTSLLNGREQVSTGDNRGVEFDQYPSELLSGVVVYKTPDASLIGQGLAGTVDLRTVRPLEFGRRAFAANVRYELNDIGALNAGTTDNGARYSISYIDQFADDTVGVAFGYAHLGSPYQSERFNAWGYPDIAPGVRVIGGTKPYVMSSELERDGFMGVVEFRPNDRWHTTLDAFYSKFDNTQILRGIEFPLQWSSASLQPGYTVTDGLVTQGQFTNVRGVVRNDVNTRESEISAFGFNTEFTPNERWTLVADVNYSAIDRTDQIIESYAGTGDNGSGAADTLTFRIDGDGVPQFDNNLNYADYNLIRPSSPQGWGGGVIPGGQDGYLNSPTVTDELFATRLQATAHYNSGPFSSVDFGVNYNEREKELIADEFFLGVRGGGFPVVPAEFRLGATSLAFIGIPGMVSYDTLGLLNSGFYDLIRNPNADVLSKNWVVSETVITPFFRANLDTDWGGVPVTGNFGFQVSIVDQNSSGFAAGPSSIRISGGDEYSEFLPSANLIFEIGDQRFLRLAAARTQARPRMDEMRASRTYGFNNALNVPGATVNSSPWSGGGGNPELKPWIANVYDISIEQYFGSSAYVSLAAFYKDLDTYIYNQNQVFDFTGFPTGAGVAVINQGIVSAPANGEGGALYGVEFAVSTPFEFISPWLEGFGGQFSISSTESEIQPDPGNPATPIPGLSETVANLTVYYERDGLQARISNRYRSEFLGEVAGFGNGRTFRQVGAESIVDAQIGYQFQSGPLEGFSALFQVNNLTDEPFYTYENGDERRIIDYQVYGRTFLFGVNYRY
ncbi:MAG: TonB-dependent receptor [Brevundimonas sp.]|uniref:TonB-dependent receptor n=1 Tax=Brevundimonas sp. TaxID=1871086 RepID=UPI002717AF61|nr:TonB-dependent receptor [Brevundimonas sp.]MDO9587737.1 TonB-dependent receptor [Brevundimonas sp.]